MPVDTTERPDIPFALHRLRRGKQALWAKRMPQAFEIRVDKGTVDQRKAGAKAKVQFVALLKGEAGDYLGIPDIGTGDRTVYSGPDFERAYELVPEDELEQ